jgi:hypothetical protein
VFEICLKMNGSSDYSRSETQQIDIMHHMVENVEDAEDWGVFF